jgi:hypothetical protein
VNAADIPSYVTLAAVVSVVGLQGSPGADRRRR